MFAHTSARFVRVDVGHLDDDAEPCWSFEMLDDAPLSSLAQALRIATGEDEWQDLEDDFTPLSWHARAWWKPDPATPVPFGRNQLHWLRVSDSHPAQVGDSRVTVRRHAPVLPRARVAWWTDETTIDPTHLQRELDVTFGFVPRVAEAWRDSRAHSPLTSLVGSLSEFERLALIARLEQRDLLNGDPLTPSELSALTVGFTTFARLIGDGVDQTEGGGVPPEVGAHVIEQLGWAPDHDCGTDLAARLTRAALEHRLVRRLRGRIVLTVRGRLADRRSREEFVRGLLIRPRREHRWDSQPSDRSTFLLLAIADGVGERLADLPLLLAEQLDALRTQSTSRLIGEAYFPTDPLSPADAASESAAILDAFGLLSAPGAYGVITPGMRRVALDVVTRPHSMHF